MRTFVTISCISVAAVFATPVLAEGTRARAGIGVEGGVIAVPDAPIGVGGFGAAASLGGIGAGGASRMLGGPGFYGRFGAQLGDLVGIYDAPHISLVAGRPFGMNLLLADSIGIDFTIADRFTAGLGPTASIWVGDAGILGEVGGTVHLAAYPWLAPREAGRRGLAISLDLTPGFMVTRPTGLLAATVGVGYETF